MWSRVSIALSISVCGTCDADWGCPQERYLRHHSPPPQAARNHALEAAAAVEMRNLRRVNGGGRHCRPFLILLSDWEIENSFVAHGACRPPDDQLRARQDHRVPRAARLPRSSAVARQGCAVPLYLRRRRPSSMAPSGTPPREHRRTPRPKHRQGFPARPREAPEESPSPFGRWRQRLR
jgi:hypothetical protein